MKFFYDDENHFMEVFDERNGMYVRSGELDEYGHETGIDPFMRKFPALLDVGIMRTCLCAHKCKIDCYQKAIDRHGANMSVEDYRTILEQCKDKTFQFALGGAGDPDTHEQFKKILEMTQEYGVIPNFTTSGIAFTTDKAKLCKDYTGAVAVSEHNADYTRKAIDMLLDAGVKTNVHYVLNNQTIDDAINKLETGYYNGINAVVFLLYKPIGLGVQEKVLKPDDARLAMFFDVVDHNHCKHKIGFDSCTCSGIVNHTRNVNMDSIDFCEAARYSAYIDADMNMMPCSFGNQNPKYFISLRDHTIEEAWHSEVFEQFRDYMQFACPNCQNRSQCGGGCPICKDIVLCNRAERTTY